LVGAVITENSRLYQKLGNIDSTMVNCSMMIS